MKIIYYIIIILSISSCVKDPTISNEIECNDGYNACFILNEGLRGRDMASITKYNLNDNLITNNYFSKSKFLDEADILIF